MNKKVYGKKLSRNTKSRLALFRGLVRSLVISGRITTTQTKAKAIHTRVEKLVRLAKSDKLSDRRRLASHVHNDRETVEKLVLYAKKHGQTQSGFVKQAKLAPRRGDNAPLAILELVKEPTKELATDKKSNEKP